MATVTLDANDRTGAAIPDQTGVLAWVSAARGSAPELSLTNQSISNGQLVLDVSGAGYTDGQVVFVEAELSDEKVAADEVAVVV